MNNISILGWDDLLNKDSHEYLVDSNTNLFGCEEGSLIELGGPNSLDSVPSLSKLVRWDTKFDQLIFDVPLMLIVLIELQGHDKLFAL